MVSVLTAILVVFLRELLSELPHLCTMEDEQVILLTLSFIDLSLTANLVLIANRTHSKISLVGLEFALRSF